VKSSTVDLRIEFETHITIPEKTAAYCLILHDQIITYNPFNGDVKKLEIVCKIKILFLNIMFFLFIIDVILQ